MRKLALIAIPLAMPLLSYAQTPRNSWFSLNTLRVGQRIEVVETNLKKHNGTFSIVTDDAIQLREGGSDVGIKREDVMRVTLLDESHRFRNAFILGAVGAGTGAGIGAAATRCSSPSNSLFNACDFRGIAIGIGAVAGFMGGSRYRSRDTEPSYSVSRRTPLTLRRETFAQVEFLEWTAGDRLRHSKFVGLREDKNPRSVVKEHVGEAASD